MIKSILKKFIGRAGTNNLTDRQLWVKNTLDSLPKGLTILDAGAGEQQYKKYCFHLIYTSQDFCEYEGKGNEQGLQTGNWDTSSIDIVCDIISIPKKDESFDIILCTEVFEHIPDPISAILEFKRLLKPGGHLIITAPFNSLTHFAPFHFSTGFSKYFYEHHLVKNDFNIIEITPNGNYSEYIAQELRRLLTYFNKTSLFTKVCIFYLLRFININKSFNQNDQLGCFGYHVHAIKK
jgi:SAM-dependent methyltransferase